jgi:hypothetical protein
MLPYYKIIDVVNLARITRELDRALPKLVTGQVDLKAVYSFNTIDPARLLELAPALTAWLDTVGLKNNLSVAGFPCTAPNSKGTIHTDLRYKYPDLPGEGINFPVYNCNQGHSIWYQASQASTATESTSGKSTNHAPMFASYLDTDAVELARVSNQYPVWFNTDIPHTGINASDKPRIILTMRFDCAINVALL